MSWLWYYTHYKVVIFGSFTELSWRYKLKNQPKKEQQLTVQISGHVFSTWDSSWRCRSTWLRTRLVIEVIPFWGSEARWSLPKNCLEPTSEKVFRAMNHSRIPINCGLSGACRCVSQAKLKESKRDPFKKVSFLIIISNFSKQKQAIVKPMWNCFIHMSSVFVGFFF